METVHCILLYMSTWLLPRLNFAFLSSNILSIVERFSLPTSTLYKRYVCFLSRLSRVLVCDIFSVLYAHPFNFIGRLSSATVVFLTFNP